MNTVELLLTWTPFLLQGFVWNIVIATVAMLIGTLMGSGFAWLSFSANTLIARMGRMIPAFFRGVPTLVLVFYLASLVPSHFEIGSIDVALPAWVKAAVALSASPMGFTAWNLRATLEALGRGDRSAAMLFVPNWMSTFLITLLASSTASLVGVSELVGRCNTVITASGSDTMLPVYLYGSLWFFIFCNLFNFGLQKVRSMLSRKFLDAK